MPTRPELSAPTGDIPAVPRPRRTHRWLLLLPFAWQLGLAPWANGVELRPFALPFPMVWQMAGVAVASAVIALVLVLDRRADSRDPSRRASVE